MHELLTLQIPIINEVLRGVPVLLRLKYLFYVPKFFFNSLAKSKYLSLFSISFNFILWSAGTAKSIIRQVLFLSLNISKFGCLAEIRLSVCISKSQKSLCLILLFELSNLNFLHYSQWITFPIKSCLILFLRWFSAFAYYMIDRCVSIIT